MLNNIIHTTKAISESKTAIISVFFAQNKFKDHLQIALKPFDLSIEQFNVLRILRGQNNNPLNLQDIQKRMVNKMSNTTRLVDKLLNKKLVIRKVCSVNRRKVDISITTIGLDILTQLDPIIDHTEEQLTATLNKEELKQLNNLLSKLNN